MLKIPNIVFYDDARSLFMKLDPILCGGKHSGLKDHPARSWALA